METTYVPLLHPRAYFQSFGLSWLFDHARLVARLTGDAYEHELEDLRGRLRGRGLPEETAASWADWAVSIARETFALELLGGVSVMLAT